MKTDLKVTLICAALLFLGTTVYSQIPSATAGKGRNPGAYLAHVVKCAEASTMEGLFKGMNGAEVVRIDRGGAKLCGGSLPS